MSNPFSLEGKTILVTGGSSGIGRAICESIANQGGNSIIIGRDSKKIEETYALLTGNNHKMYQCDLTNNDDLELLVDKLENINGVVHSAGIVKFVPIKMVSDNNYNAIFDINIKVPIFLNKLLIKKKKIITGSSIVHIASIMSQIGVVGNGLYACTKSALVSLTRVLALEVAKNNIRVNCISPGMVVTPMAQKTADMVSQESLDEHKALYPLGFGTPNDVANAAVYLLSDASKWVTGTNLILDGGYTIQ